MLKVLIVYDDEKMVIDTYAKKLYVWHRYHDDYEDWFIIDYSGQENLVEAFFRREVPLLGLMRATKIEMAKRYYGNYSEFEATGIVPTEESHRFPRERSYYTGIKFSLSEINFYDFPVFITTDKLNKPVDLVGAVFWGARYRATEYAEMVFNRFLERKEVDHSWRDAA